LHLFQARNTGKGARSLQRPAQYS